MGYLYANFSLYRPLSSRLRPDVLDRHQTASSFNAPLIRGGACDCGVSQCKTHSFVYVINMTLRHREAIYSGRQSVADLVGSSRVNDEFEQSQDELAV